MVLFTGLLVSQNSLISEVYASHSISTDTLYLGNQKFQSAEINTINKTDGVPIADPLVVVQGNFVTFEPNTNSTWQYREHNAGGGDSSLMWLLDCNVTTPDAECETTSFDGLQLLDLTNAGAGASEETGSDWYFFKSFNVSPKFINSMTWRVVGGITSDFGGDTGIMTWEVRDGTYDRRSASDFPTGSAVPLKGAGVLQLFETQVGTGTHSFAIDPLAMNNTQTDTYTLMGRYQQCNGCSNVVNIDQTSFDDWVTWDFDNTNTSKTREVIDTDGDYGLADAGAVVISGTGGVDVVNQLGLAIDPTDNTAYAIYKTIERNADRMLATVDLATGVTTQVGFITESVTGLEFKHDGELRAICGNGCFIDPIGTLYDIDKTNADKTALCTITVPTNQGKELAFDHDNEIMYLTGSNSGTAVWHVITSESTCATSNLGISGYGVTNPEVLGMAYHTSDNLFYGIFGGNAFSDDFFSQSTGGFRTLISVDPFGGDKQKGMSFDYSIIPPDSVPPVISAIGSEPITITQFTPFNIFDNVQCIDDVDGNIPSGANFALDGIQTVDNDLTGLQSQKYTCTDTATNNSLETIDYLVNRANSGGGSGSGTPSQQAGDLPPVDVPLRELDQIDRAFSFFDQLNAFFDTGRSVQDLPDRASQEPELLRCPEGTVVDDASKCPSQQPPTEEGTRAEQERGGFAQAISDFFASLFG